MSNIDKLIPDLRALIEELPNRKLRKAVHAKVRQVLKIRGYSEPAQQATVTEIRDIVATLKGQAS